MKFYDAHIVYGLPAGEHAYTEVADVPALNRHLERAGITGALVRREEQVCSGAIYGNQLVAADVKNTDHLWGVWALLPPHTHELPEPDRILSVMKENRIAAWQCWPSSHHYCFHDRVLKEWFSLAQRHYIPLCLDLSTGITDREILEVLGKYPELTVILTPASVWPADRRMRPFLEEFPNTYMEISLYIADGGLEGLVEHCGAQKILFGTGFQRCYLGGNMLQVKHAQISEKDKTAIAGENMERILGRIEYD